MKTSTIARWGCSVPIVALLLLIIASCFTIEYRISEGKRKLPQSASAIQQEGFHGIIGGDHTGLTKAKLPKDAYADYAKALGLTVQFDPKLHSDIESTLNIKAGGGTSWWNPPAVDETAYFEYTEGRTHLRILRYHDGFVYYQRLSW